MEVRCLLISPRDFMINNNVVCKKGQYFSFDAIVGSVIFILALVTLLSYWYSLRTALNSQTNDLTREALRISDLILTPGYPAGVSCNDMKQLGFSMSWQDRRINKTKFECAKAIKDEKILREKFSSSFNISMKIGKVDNIIATIGDDISLIQPKQIAKVRRVVTILDEKNEENLVYFDIYVYQ